MEQCLWTVHHRPGRELEAISGERSLLAFFLPPVWAIWHRCWISFAVIVLLPGLIGLISPLGAMAAFYGVAMIASLEGGAIRRAELRLWGWREVGCVMAGSEEGAEELYMSGRPA